MLRARFAVLALPALVVAGCRGGSRSPPDTSSAPAVVPVAVTPSAPMAAVPSGERGPPLEPPLRPMPDCKHPPVVERCAKGFCRIEAGCFIMGAPRGEYQTGRRSDRQVQVTISRSFLIGRTELTRAQWQSVGWALPNPKSPNDKECVDT